MKWRKTIYSVRVHMDFVIVFMKGNHNDTLLVRTVCGKYRIEITKKKFGSLFGIRWKHWKVKAREVLCGLLWFTGYFVFGHGKREFERKKTHRLLEATFRQTSLIIDETLSVYFIRSILSYRFMFSDWDSWMNVKKNPIHLVMWWRTHKIIEETTQKWKL